MKTKEIRSIAVSALVFLLLATLMERYQQMAHIYLEATI